MRSTGTRRRLAGTAAAALIAGAGVLAAAPSAMAKANVLTIEKVSLQKPDVQVKVTYSCDPGLDHQLVANAQTLGTHDVATAAGTIKRDKLICDSNSHQAQVNMRPATGSHFVKGNKVKVTVFYFDSDGFSYAREDAAVVL
ncbi:hypothetical protein ACH5A3_23020 [Streptomyces echinatus]|uniref:hypothetical protein n=1 Tax=Streptomyces echinatus TaxID=67293 RepID=UPI0037A03DF2